MPGAATHDRIALVAAGALAIPSYLSLRYGLGDDPAAAYSGTLLLVGSHLFGSWLLSPDLDVDSKIDDRWGPLRPIWVPYMRIVPHRHVLSHSGLSGFLRLVYLYLVIFSLLVVFSFGASLLDVDVQYHQMFSNWLWDSFRNGTRPALLFIAGVIISDLVHVVADRLDTRRKRIFRHMGLSRRR